MHQHGQHHPPAQSGIRYEKPTSGPTGRWYFVVTLLSFGFLAAVPFWHAANHLQRPDVRRLALVYTALDAFLVVLMALTPDPDAPGSDDSVLSTIGGFTAFAVMFVGVLQLGSLRRQVYGRPVPVPVSDDPAVARALAARRRRYEARALRASDPSLARELGIGRPDLGRGYDDGGLVDVNTAPAAVLARLAGIDPPVAEAIVAARDARGGYFNLDELFIDVPLPRHVQDQLRDRALT